MTTNTTSRRVPWGRLLLALPFFGGGLTKLMGLPVHLESFAHWGYPAFFVFVVGAAEVAAAIGLLWRRTAGLSAAGLVLVTMGAFATHALHHEWGAVLPPLVLGVCAGLVARIHLRRPPRGFSRSAASATPA